jgi:DNA polymerase-3 subunit gamma/tau
VTRLKLAPSAAAGAAMSETERARGAGFAETLSLRELARAWQMLVKGIEEVGLAQRPLAAAEMVLVRLCYAADLPTPDEAIRKLRDEAPAPRSTPTGGRASVSAGSSQGGRALAAPHLESAPAPTPAAKPELILRSFADVIAKAKAERDRLLVFALERQIRPVRFEPGQIEIALTEDAEPTLPQKLGEALRAWTGNRWMVAVSKAEAVETVHETRKRTTASLLDEARADPLVQKVLERFPGAEIVGVREKQTEVQPAELAGPLINPDDTTERAEGED